MTDQTCLAGCPGDSPDGFRPSFKSGVSGQARLSSVESSLPPLPEPITLPAGLPKVHDTQPSYPGEAPDARDSGPVIQTAAARRSTGPGVPLQAGCYFLRLIPTSLHTPSRFQYEGTLRFQENGGSLIASGDLYKKDACKTPTYCPTLTSTPGARNSIPIFPRKQYAYYLRVTGIHADEGYREQVLIEFDPHRFLHSTQTWCRDEYLTAQLRQSSGPDGISYWRGDLSTRSNIALGHIIMVRVSPFLRKAVVEIDRVAASECPERNERGDDWQSIFRDTGWDVTVDFSDDNVEEPEDKSWSNAELHKKMLKYRQSVDLDKQWRYHLMAVRKLDDDAFGVMYDNSINDIDNIPREGAAIASHVIFPEDDCWGKCRGKRFGTFRDPYFRTAVHEIGHALMLYHPDNPYENYIMQKTVQIAHNSMPQGQFPENIEWSFSPRDIHFLCHVPDIAIRPGGFSFGTPQHRLPVSAKDEVMEAEGLELKVDALHDVVPIGAPVRINFTLHNPSERERMVPGSLSMKSGHVSAKVITPSGTTHDFATIIRYTGDVMPQVLKPGQTIGHSVTLLWGANGPLFPTSGFYRIILKLDWYLDGVSIRISGTTSVMVTPPTDEEHARIALRIFSSPDALLALAIGGDHLETGNRVIQEALSHPVLKPHYNLVEAKRVGQRFFNRKPRLKDTVEMVDEDTVMSPTEVIRLARILKYFADETEQDVVDRMAVILMKKAGEVNVRNEVERMLEGIQYHL